MLSVHADTHTPRHDTRKYRATGAVHHHLIKRQLRCKCALVVASADPRDVHDLCLLVGFGADAVYPYMVYRCFIALGDELHHDGEKKASSSPQQPQLKKDLLTPCPAIGKYRSAIDKGILKVMAKMGISTLASYKGAQVFEAVGLGRDVVKTCFKGVSSRLSGTVIFLLAYYECVGNIHSIFTLQPVVGATRSVLPPFRCYAAQVARKGLRSWCAQDAAQCGPVPLARRRRGARSRPNVHRRPHTHTTRGT